MLYLEDVICGQSVSTTCEYGRFCVDTFLNAIRHDSFFNAFLTLTPQIQASIRKIKEDRASFSELIYK